MLRRKARRAEGAEAPPAVAQGADDLLDTDPLDAAQERRVRAVLALGGVPQSDLLDGVQQVRLRLLERAASGREAPRDVSAWVAVVASNIVDVESAGTPYGWMAMKRVWLAPFSPPIATCQRLRALGDGHEVRLGGVALRLARRRVGVLQRRGHDHGAEDLLV